MELELENGPLAYREKGSGRPYLLLNGLPFGSSEFQEVLDVLSWSSRAIAVDLPGIGASASLPDPSPSSLADALLFSFAKFGIDSFVLAASDVAGPVAMEIVKKQPGSVAGLLLFNTCIVPRGLKLPRYLETSKTAVIDLLRPTRRLEKDIVCVMGRAEKLGPECLQTGLKNLSRSARKEAARMFRGLGDAPFLEYQDVLKRFRKPIHLLWGERDPVFSKLHFTALCGLLPEAPAHCDANTGHFFGIEEPNLLAQTLQTLGRNAWP